MAIFKDASIRGIICIAIASIWFLHCAGTTITLTPAKLDLKKTGETFTVKCQVDDSDNSQNITSPTWFKVNADGTDKRISTSGTVQTRPRGRLSYLAFNSAALNDAGTYKCVSDGLAATIDVKINQKITFIETPTEQHPIVGTNAVIKCRVEADPRPEISWSKDGTDISENGGRYTVSDDGDLTIPNFDSATDNGEYVCEALQSETGDTKHLNIAVTGYVSPFAATLALVDTEKWSNGVHEDASNVRISCFAGGVPTPKYNWTKDGVTLSDDGHFKISQTGILEITKVRRDDGGNYHCLAYNDVGDVETTLRVQIFEKPRIEKIASQNVTADRDVSFECKYTGSNEMEAVWMSQGRVIPVGEQGLGEDGNTSPKPSEKYVTMEEGKAILHLKAVKLSDAGEYQCRVSNDAGTANESANLRVLRSPLIVSKTTGNVRAVLNTERTLYCEALALPEATWSWWKDGKELSAVDGQIEITTTLGGDMHHSVSTLKIVLSSDDDFGSYTCRAVNEHEPSAEATIKVIMIEPPLAPSVSCGNDITPTIVTLDVATFSMLQLEINWPTDVDIVVTRADDFAFVTSASLKFASSGHYKIPKLDPSTGYIFNVTGRNEAGSSTWAIATCTTMQPAPPGKPIFLDAEPIRCNSTKQCTIAWNLEDNGGKPVSKYLLRSWLIGTGGEPNEEQPPVETDGPSYTFTSLKPKAIYEISVMAFNAEGPGEASLTRLTSPDASADTPDDVFVGADGTGAGTIVAIVIIIVLLIVVLVDVACYYVNHCGLLMCICVNVCGKPSPEVKSKEAMIEQGGVKETRIDESFEQKELKGQQNVYEVVSERVEVDATTTESTPMIPSGQNGEKRTVSTVV